MSVSAHNEEEDYEQIDYEKEDEELALEAFNKKDARNFAAPEIKFYIIGSIGACIAGGVFPAWGIVFAEMIGLLFYPAFPCEEPDSIPGDGVHATCQDYYDFVVEDMKQMSFEISAHWTGHCGMLRGEHVGFLCPPGCGLGRY